MPWMGLRSASHLYGEWHTNYKGAWTNDKLTYAIFTTAPGYNEEGGKERMVILFITGGTKEFAVQQIDIGEKYSYTINDSLIINFHHNLQEQI